MIGNYTELLYRIAVPAFSTGLYYSVWATSHWLIVCCMVKRDKPTAVLFLYYETNLKDAALNLGYTLDPFVNVSDSEISMIQAATINFPNACRQGCYYH